MDQDKKHAEVTAAEPHDSSESENEPGSLPQAEDSLSIGGWTEKKRLARRTFPGPRAASAILRVAFERTAYADLLVHARESVDAEVCGVLVGQPCKDEDGLFVEVEAIIRGTAANQGRAHVTYTQDTWNSIHEELQKKYPRLQIVGWYHTHPGYGVQLSEMDLFIQENFFSGPAQIAVVVDPLGGQVGLCANPRESRERDGSRDTSRDTSGDSSREARRVQYVDRFWVDGREHRAFVPSSNVGSSAGDPTRSQSDDKRIEALELRISQLMTAVDDLRGTVVQTVFWTAAFIVVAVGVALGYNLYSVYKNPGHPPEGVSFAPVPVKVGDKTCILGVNVVSWEIPRELIPGTQTDSTAGPGTGSSGSNDSSSQKPSPQEQPSDSRTGGGASDGTGGSRQQGGSK